MEQVLKERGREQVADWVNLKETRKDAAEASREAPEVAVAWGRAPKMAVDGAGIDKITCLKEILLTHK